MGLQLARCPGAGPASVASPSRSEAADHDRGAVLLRCRGDRIFGGFLVLD